MMMRTMDMQDSNFDGIDDRDQRGGGMQDMRARPPQDYMGRKNFVSRPPQQIGNMMMPRPPQGGIGSFPIP